MIYFDSAATSMQKPESVTQAVVEAMTSFASPGRGDSSASVSAAEILFSCRETAAELFHVAEPEQVVFTFHATHALNIAIRSLAKPGSRVIISGYEHNAVVRPLAAIKGITLHVIDTPLFEPELFLERLEDALRGGLDLMVCTHVSNVFGYILPIQAVAQLCARWEVPLIVDAAQSAGVLPLDLEAWRAAFIAMPGHKSLYGPQGTGLLLCGLRGEPLLFGGTGSFSALREMPEELPDRLEAGTQNVAGIAGLLEGLRFVREQGEPAILKHEQALRRKAAEGLRALPGIELFECADEALQSGVLSFRMAQLECEEIGEYLSAHQVAVRTGLHCAPLAHACAGTLQSGTVRLSFSAFNTEEEVETLLFLLQEMCRRRGGARRESE